MITLFRRIRQKLIESGSTTKYLLYAIGEILLVVIGILIALQVNNWNEERKQQIEVEASLIEIKKNLSVDIERAADIYEGLLSVREKSMKISLGEMTRDDFYDFENYIGYGYYNFVVSKSGYTKFKELVKDLGPEYNELDSKLDALYVTLLNNITIFNNRIQNTVYENIDYLSDNKPWYHAFGTSIVLSSMSDEMADFFVNSPVYKNQSQKYANDAGNLFRDVQAYRVDAAEIMADIDALLNENTGGQEGHRLSASAVLNSPEDLTGRYAIVATRPESNFTDTLTIERKNGELMINRYGDNRGPGILYAHGSDALFEKRRYYGLLINTRSPGYDLTMVDRFDTSYWNRIDE